MNGVVEEKFKILLLGDSFVGKTHFYNELTNEPTAPDALSTIGVQFKTKMMIYDNKNIKLDIWDTAGQERYRSITKNFFKGAHGIFLIYDITNKESKQNIKEWLKTIKEVSNYDTLSLILIGNKSDLENNRKVDFEEGQKLAQTFNGGFIETSALKGINVHEALLLLLKSLMTNLPLTKLQNIKHTEDTIYIDQISSNQLKEDNQKSKCKC